MAATCSWLRNWIEILNPSAGSSSSSWSSVASPLLSSLCPTSLDARLRRRRADRDQTFVLVKPKPVARGVLYCQRISSPMRRALRYVAADARVAARSGKLKVAGKGRRCFGRDGMPRERDCGVWKLGQSSVIGDLSGFGIFSRGKIVCTWGGLIVPQLHAIAHRRVF